MKCTYACGSHEHEIARRQFLGSVAAGTGAVIGGLGWFAQPAAASQLLKQQKRMIVVRMAGGLSQLESWDPKPKTETGGPFRSIPTSVPGTHISELLPHTAKIMQHLSLVRGVNTNNGDHGKGTYMMMTGRRKTPASDYPELGAVVAKGLDAGESALPGHIKVTASGSGSRGKDSAYLGPKYSSMQLNGGKAPANSSRSSSLKDDAAQRRNEFRMLANNHFSMQRRTAETDAYVQSFEQAKELMAKKEIFDLEKESKKDHERYGDHAFGRHCLLARRLVENDIPFVQITHSNYDTHNENFNFHFEQLGEFDQPFATLIGDLVDRGLYEHTLVVVLSEFGRTPKINARYGRDHWGKAWSVAMGGVGIQNGAIIGATNDKGTEVTDREVDCGHLFHTYLRAMGIRSHKDFEIGGRRFPIADPAVEPIHELLA
ncbi:MAG: hypothetical protein CMO80_19300 [Verrucomicrobiales bacterium]|nr:hypothetical protein [Verrucomicrobiales bacterium]|tara:strand:+ start:782 stop:2071 length:1290 start_codon:yes stop_codon:yes gene_type:complete